MVCRRVHACLPCPIRHARTGLENFGCERGLGLSTHWQWSVMVTGEQSSNRAHDEPDNQFIRPMHGWVLNPARRGVIPDCYVLARICTCRSYVCTLIYSDRLSASLRIEIQLYLEMSVPEGRCSVETDHADIAVSLRNRLVKSNSMELQAKLLAGAGIVKGCKKGEKSSRKLCYARNSGL